MFARPAMLLVVALGLSLAGSASAQAPSDDRRLGAPLPGLPSPAGAALGGASLDPARLAGTWELAVAGRSAACRLVLRAEKSDKGDYFLGMPAACRHAMPWLGKVGRWGRPDAAHLTLDEPGGAAVLALDAAGDGFTGALGGRTLTLTRVGRADPADGAASLDGPVGAAALVPVARRRAAPEGAAVPPAARLSTETPAEVAGRYAIMRDKRDTGCMLTLDDRTRGRAGGDRAQLAPGCRDQGIVIFDPVGWRLVKGMLVLTARAGHTATLEKIEEGRWSREAKEGGKPLGLKRL